MTKTLEERLACGEISVVEQGVENIRSETGFLHPGRYRILSDGRKQWRPLSGDGRNFNRFVPWKTCD